MASSSVPQIHQASRPAEITAAARPVSAASSRSASNWELRCGSLYEAADEWVKGREAVVALSLEDAFALAQVHWVERASRE